MAFPQLPWTAPTRGGRPQPPAVRETSSPGRSTAPGSSQVPRPAGARSCRGGWRGRRGRAARAAGARVLGAGLPPPSSARLASRSRLAGAKASCELSARAAPLALAPAAPPPPGGGSRRHRRLRVRRHLPRRHLFSSRSIGASSAPLEPPRLPSPRWCSGVAPQPAPPPPLTRATRSCRSLVRTTHLFPAGVFVLASAIRSLAAGVRSGASHAPRRARRHVVWRLAPCGACRAWVLRGGSPIITTLAGEARTQHTRVFQPLLVTIRSRNSILFSLSDTLRPPPRARAEKRASYAVWTIK